MAVYQVYKAVTDQDIEYGGAGAAAAGAVGVTGGALHARRHAQAAQKIRSSMPQPKRTWKVWKQPANLAASRQAIKDIAHHEGARIHGKLGAVAAGTIGVAGGATGALTAWHKSHPNGEGTGMAKSAFGVEDDRISKAGGLHRIGNASGRRWVAEAAEHAHSHRAPSAASRAVSATKSGVQRAGRDVRTAARATAATSGRVVRTARATVGGEAAAGRLKTVSGAAGAAGHTGRQVLMIPGVKPALYAAGGLGAAGGAAGGVALAAHHRDVNKSALGDLAKPFTSAVKKPMGAAGQAVKGGAGGVTARAKKIVPTLRQMPGRLGATTNAYLGGAKAAGQLNTAGDSLRAAGGLARQYTKVPGVKPLAYGAGGTALVGTGAAVGSRNRNQ
jgi:hypothetical protein